MTHLSCVEQRTSRQYCISQYLYANDVLLIDLRATAYNGNPVNTMRCCLCLFYAVLRTYSILERCVRVESVYKEKQILIRMHIHG